MRRYEVLEKLIKANQWKRGAEIGVYAGRTFFHLLKTCNVELIGVDCWIADEGEWKQDRETGVSTPRKAADMKHFAEQVKKDAEKYKNATVLHMKSLEAAKLIEDESLDFVFIDAEHTTECVLEDIAAWRPKIKPGGWLMGHDEEWPAVRRALAQAVGKWTVHDDNVWSVP